MKRFTILLLTLATLFGAVSADADTSGLSRWLYSIAEKMPHSAAPGETLEQYKERLAGMTKAVAVSMKPYANGQGWTTTELGLMVLEVWNAETLFDQRIHAGLEHPKWTQDSGRAKCMGQIHVSVLVPQEQWEKTVGTDEGATQLCADATARVVVAQARNCGVWAGQRADRNKVAKVFAAYASGGACVPTERDYARADKWNSFIARRPDRSPIRGFRRAGAGELTPEAVEEARRMAADLGKEPSVHVGSTSLEFGSGPAKYQLLVEKHADNKVGVSIFLKEAQAGR
jgi:hypothetical protein